MGNSNQALFSLFAGVAAFSLACIEPSLSADVTFETPAQPMAAESGSMALQITPYMWGAGLKGDISPFRRGPTIGVEKSFSDVLDDLNFGGFLNVWGRYDRFIFSGDVMYVNTTDSRNTGPLPGMTLPGIGSIPPGANVKASLDTRQFNATLMGGYRVVDTPGFSLDALGGVRFWHISNDVTLTGDIGNLSRTITYEESFGWVDPLVGLRLFMPVTENLSVQAQADIGGFGVGADLTWSALATVNYAFTDHLSASLGYKVLDVDYADKGHVFNTRLSGPVLGMTYRF